MIGLGRFGRALAEELAHAGAELMILDQDEEKLRPMHALSENVYVVKSLDKASLLETGIQDCDAVIVCIGERLDISILTALCLKQMGVSKVIAKANSAEHGAILEKLGAEVVYPERDMAVCLANRLANAQTPNRMRQEQ